MHLKHIMELSMLLDNERFQELMEQIYDNAPTQENFNDDSMCEEGFLVLYRNSEYKKKVRLVVDPVYLGSTDKPDQLVKKLDKQIQKYFSGEYCLHDFTVSGFWMQMEISVDKGTVEDYLAVLKRVGRVKGFTPDTIEEYQQEQGLVWHGNSNGILFLLYPSMKNTLKTEVRLVKVKAVRTYVDELCTEDQILDLFRKSSDIFMDIFHRIIPYGDFYKKKDAMEILNKEVEDIVLRRKMVHLLTLIPERKSLLLAQKATHCRQHPKVIRAFAEMGLSPVTISKRSDRKYLKNLYSYF